MLKKILIAEDFDSYSIGIEKAISDQVNVEVVDKTYYCDDAILKLRAALSKNDPYDLLITDLSFASDYREQELEGGEDLIYQIKQEQPNLKIIVFSIENRYHKINHLFEKYKINAFVTKGRDDIKDLKKAIEALKENKSYISDDNKISKSNLFELTEYDINLLKLLAKGFTQKEVENYLKKEKITPNSESSIEKKLALLRITFNAKDTKHLLSLAVELGII
ncbi:response regulator transcription factor [Apibacter muscae]|uniref:response regulator n=1 Tax=Apibacter muscae TaxID=2509004 RepID=UPI0011AD5258|nr:response regulator [Apibacter muscae]TWP24114.1 response regulator transcription factor [Apibacter muscae]